MEIISKLINGLTDKISGLFENKIGSEAVSGIQNAVSKLDGVNKTISGATDFLTAKLIPNKTAEQYPDVYLGIKGGINASKIAVEESEAKLARLLKDATDNDIEQFSRILINKDAFRDKLQGIPTPVQTSLDDLSTLIKNDLQTASPKTIQMLNEMDDVIKSMEENNPVLRKTAEEFRKSFNDTLDGQKAGKLNDIFNVYKEATGKDPDIWNFYYPHLKTDEYLHLGGDEELLSLFFPRAVKSRRMFFEKPRVGSEKEFLGLKIKDGDVEIDTTKVPLILRTLLFEESRIRQYRNIFNNMSYSANLLNKLTPREFELPSVKNFLDEYGTKTGFFIPRELLPDEITKHLPADETGAYFWDMNSLFNKSRISYKKKDELLADVLQHTAGDIDPARLNLIPASLYDVFANYYKYVLGSSGANETYRAITGITNYWKRFATTWGRFIPFSLANTMGDLFNVLMKQPTALRKLPQAFNFVWDLIVRGRLPEERLVSKLTNEELLSALNKSGAIQTLMSEFSKLTYNPILNLNLGVNKGLFEPILDDLGKSSDLIQKLKSVGSNIYGRGGLLEKINIIRETTPKLASILDNFERVEKGLFPDFTGAEKYILGLNKKGDLDKAILERGATITVDYSAVPPAYRKFMTQFLAPFGYWYSRTADSLGGMLLEAPTKLFRRNILKQEIEITPEAINGLKRWGWFYFLPVVAGYYWNTSSPERKKIWDNLPSYLKFTPLTLVLGVDEENKKPIVFSFYTPAHMVADLFGFDRFAADYDKVKNNLMTPQDAVTDFLFGSVVDIPQKLVNFTNPIIQGFISTVTNKDMFLNRPIIPDNLVGTPEGNRKLFYYFSTRVLSTPIVPMLQVADYKDISELVNDIYGIPEKEGSKIFNQLKQIATNWFDVGKGLGFVDVKDGSVFALNATIQKNRELTGAYESYMSKALNEYLKGNIDEFIKMRNDASSGKYIFINESQFDDYFNRPTVINKIAQDILKKKDLTQEEKDRAEQLMAYAKLFETIEKETRMFLRPELRQNAEQILKIVNGENIE